MFVDVQLEDLQVFKEKDKPLKDFGDNRMELY